MLSKVQKRWNHFVKSKGILNLISIANMYHKLPSEILGLRDEYTSYCLNEACTYILGRLNDGETPVFRKEYKSFSDLYSQIGTTNRGE